MDTIQDWAVIRLTALSYFFKTEKVVSVIQKLTTDTSVTGQICSVAKHAVLPQWLQRQGKWFQYILLKARRLVQGFCTSSPG